MLFNSFDFVVFAPIAIAGAILLRGAGLKLWLIVLSYIFYGWAAPWYCLLLVASTVLDYTVALQLHATQNPHRRKLWLLASLAGNLGMLGFFKYADFTIGTYNALANTEVPLLELFLPAGISFYTFQTLSYTIDVYRGRMTPTRNFLTMAAYVSFFPQLVAGPIERAGDLMPQLENKPQRAPDDVLLGVTRILWGLTKKVVFADWLGFFAFEVIQQPDAYTTWDVALAITCFAFVIYLDFSAYSDIAIGLARCMGVRLRENFKHPYLARNISEFWRRWHISLSEWLRDYLYFPLGGSRKGVPRTLLNLTIVMALGGLWHGAGWPFVLWGLWHGLGLVVFHSWSELRARKRGQTERPKRADGFAVFKLRDLPAIALTFAFVWVSWVLFAAGSMENANAILSRLFTQPWGEIESLFAPPGFDASLSRVGVFLGIAVIMHLVRGLLAGRLRSERLQQWAQHPITLGVFWAGLLIIMALAHAPVAVRFIYFQF